jgi:cellobiose-specific phosphotransferase system component IIC
MLGAVVLLLAILPIERRWNRHGNKSYVAAVNLLVRMSATALCVGVLLCIAYAAGYEKEDSYVAAIAGTILASVVVTIIETVKKCKIRVNPIKPKGDK